MHHLSLARSLPPHVGQIGLAVSCSPTALVRVLYPPHVGQIGLAVSCSPTTLSPDFAHPTKKGGHGTSEEVYMPAR